jgi:hypothetical protein
VFFDGRAAMRDHHPSPAYSAAGCYLKIRQVICVGTRVNEPMRRKDRVTKMSSSSWSYFGFALFDDSQNLQVKSLILAQIERWRRA